MNLDAIYELTAKAPELASSLRFTAGEWRIYHILATEAPKTARSIMRGLDVASEYMVAILDKMHSAALIQERMLTYDEFLAGFVATAPPPIEPLKPAIAEAPKAVEVSTIVEPFKADDARPAAPSLPVKDVQGKVSFTLRKRSSSPPALVAPPPETAFGPLRVQSLIHFIRERSGGTSLGQLAVYRVFLKVPQELLESAGFDQLDLENTDAEITDPVLAETIREKTCEVTGSTPAELEAALRLAAAT